MTNSIQCQFCEEEYVWYFLNYPTRSTRICDTCHEKMNNCRLCLYDWWNGKWIQNKECAKTRDHQNYFYDAYNCPKPWPMRLF